MAIETKEEALALIQSLRLTVKDKTGFAWLTNELDELILYVENVVEENERLKSRTSGDPNGESSSI